MPLRIGYAGLGSLGSAIFPNLVSFASEQGFPAPSVWNRSQGKYDAIKERFPDVHTAENLLELLNCNVVFTCLANDAAAEDVYGQLVNGLDEGNGKGRAGYRLVMFADQSTLKVETTLKIKKLVEGVGAVYLTTPVFGQPAAARAKQLVCVNSGIYDGRKIVAPMLKAIGKHTIDVGDDNAKGASLKLLGNSIILGAVQLYAESYALSDAIGFDPAVFHELHQNVFAAPALLNYSNKISKGKFGDAGFTVTGGLKDAGHILSLAPEMGLSVSLPTIERAKKNLERARDEGHGDLDWAALASVVRADAGLPPFREGTDEGKQSAL